jgi:hypothetical protein
LRYLWFFNFAYKRRAKRKGLEVSITNEEFIKLVTSNCHYCDRDWKLENRVVNKRNINMLTIDRKNPKLGYVLDNCVSCCKSCNTAKMDMQYDEFLEKIKIIYNKLLNTSLLSNQPQRSI